MTWVKLVTVEEKQFSWPENVPEFVLYSNGELWMNKKLKVPGAASNKLPGGKKKMMKKGKRKGY